MINVWTSTPSLCLGQCDDADDDAVVAATCDDKKRNHAYAREFVFNAMKRKGEWENLI